ncbi:hypothetical protein D3C72_2526670 [compost metagenome]
MAFEVQQQLPALDVYVYLAAGGAGRQWLQRTNTQGGVAQLLVDLTGSQGGHLSSVPGRGIVYSRCHHDNASNYH